MWKTASYVRILSMLVLEIAAGIVISPLLFAAVVWVLAIPVMFFQWAFKKLYG